MNSNQYVLMIVRNNIINEGNYTQTETEIMKFRDKAHRLSIENVRIH